ncbi:MAG: glycosyltransferase family 4 protein [Sedimentisphaerales bacterium]|nr:glycosyltransferase family 4 protein [Sedimentisphaerales bacterium]
MKVCIVHNEYGKFSGEESAVGCISELLKHHGHEVVRFTRNSSEIPNMRFGKLNAFFSGIYSPASRRQMRKIIRDYQPDIIQIQNLYPLISPSVILEARKHKIPIVMRCANYRLVCPNGIFLSKGRICEKCSRGREYNCLLNNCENSFFKSLGYFLRNWFARYMRFYKDNVIMYCCLTEFQKQKLINEGFDAERIAVIPNMVAGSNIEPSDEIGDYVGFVGRVSPEKGIDTLVKAAEILPEIRFKLAGDYDGLPKLVKNAPDNCEFLGPVKQENIFDFYKGTRFVVLPSVCYEGFPMVLVEAMLSAKPVIASKIGGIPEIVEDGKTGLLFEPGNSKELSDKICYLWARPELCRKMGKAGREKALREYSPERYHQRLMHVYKKAMELKAVRRKDNY